ncbi:hypothetical protein CEUSTIGMA_g5545.t1 [Chlamydomonas eustigma]|uniref:Uncharacterized protein n=1 Tax=Chlamydomonas eustigma TaxID=1157962 RepID=A0A250X4U6_9CHLO|nr:hypothetical protein CEUSTIGMA_g5545.t1 [Chlamydomonas eustigma]|eukprot:GAX78103.1 hypothetical protein CEUSTIGMA_g5545.t1 [Chlamydomonas eustigma]
MGVNLGGRWEEGVDRTKQLSHLISQLQNLGVRTMDRTKQLSHLISQLQNYHEYVVSERCGDASYPWPARRSTYPAAHITVSNKEDSPFTTLDAEAKHAAHVTSYPDSHVDAEAKHAAHVTSYPDSHVDAEAKHAAHVTSYPDSHFVAEAKHAAHVTSYPDSHVDDEQDRVTSLQENLVHAYSQATFPSRMHPRGNNRAPLPAVASTTGLHCPQ